MRAIDGDELLKRIYDCGFPSVDRNGRIDRSKVAEIVDKMPQIENDDRLISNIKDIIAEMENDLNHPTGSDDWNDGYDSCCRPYLGMLKDLIK